MLKKDIGLKLVGTIVADNAAFRRAVIDNQKTGEQNAYFEGDQASIFRIKKILRNNVIISSEKGDALLTIKPEDFEKVSNESISEQDASMSSSSTDQTSKEKTTTRRRREKRIAREDVISSLENLDELMQNVKFTPYTRNNQLKGLRITGITPDSILRKMGLHNRDVVMGINNEPITDQDQVGRLFSNLMEESELTIKFRRRRRTRTLRVTVE